MISNSNSESSGNPNLWVFCHWFRKLHKYLFLRQTGKKILVHQMFWRNEWRIFISTKSYSSPNRILNDKKQWNDVKGKIWKENEAKLLHMYIFTGCFLYSCLPLSCLITPEQFFSLGRKTCSNRTLTHVRVSVFGSTERFILQW